MRIVGTALLLLAVAGCSTTTRTTGQPSPQTTGQPSAQSDGEFVWVCHGNRNPRWQRVAVAAADAHRRHGDRVSSRPRERGAACDNAG